MSTPENTETEAGFPIGPVQLLVVGFVTDEFTGKILPELRRLRDLDLIRLVDLLVVRKDAEGQIETHQVSDLEEEEAETFGALTPSANRCRLRSAGSTAAARRGGRPVDR